MRSDHVQTLGQNSDMELIHHGRAAKAIKAVLKWTGSHQQV